jgi:uracil-DNA glycosylase
MKWDDLKLLVENCQYETCPRNSEHNIPIFFGRGPNSLNQIRFVVISQEPGNRLWKEYKLSSHEIEKKLIQDCLKPTKRKTTVPHRLNEIFGAPFNPSSSPVYWTHALKCLPKESNQQISEDWTWCALNCVNHLKKELTNIPGSHLAVITIGNYALSLCRHLLEGVSIPRRPKGIMDFIRYHNPSRVFRFVEKKIQLFPFIHPSNRQRNLSHDKGGEIEAKEKLFIAKIQHFLPTL